MRASIGLVVVFVSYTLLAAPALRAEGPGEIIQGVPPGWELVKITNDPELDQQVAMNNVGQIVFVKRMLDGTPEELFLYDNGKLRQLTFDQVQDLGPRINDDGTIVWYHLGAFPGDDIDAFIWRDGVTEPLPDEGDDDFRPDITNGGLIMWSRRPEGETAQLVKYEGGVVTQVTDNGFTNVCVRINENDDFAWIAYDFDAEPHWLSTIFCSIGGVVHQLTDGTNQPQGCAITDEGMVGWYDEGGVKLWQRGNTAVVPNTDENAAGPLLNNVGDILYASFLGEYWSPFLVRNGVTFQLSNSEALSMSGGNINDRGEVTLALGDLPEKDIWLMWRIRDMGDFTGNGVVDRFDFESRQNCLSNPGCGTQIPPVCYDVFDFDEDGDLDFHDFGAFQRLVTPNQ